jgi:hypothetical protein
MGSAIRPRPPGALLLAEIEVISRRPTLDPVALMQALDDALDDLSTREATLRYLGCYLSRCVTGSVPDYRIWEPTDE